MNLSFRVGDAETDVARNRELFFGRLGIRPDEIAVPDQVHGTTVAIAERPGHYAATDALVTSGRRVFLCVTVADCAPLILYDPVRGALGVVHAGWKGTAAGIASRALAVMGKAFGTPVRDVLAYIGPAARSCCYQVGADVAALFDSLDLREEKENLFLDVPAANRRQLLAAGILPGRLELDGRCTICDSLLFHSYRRDRENSGRMMGVAGLL
jgi:hypothetical protein